MDPQWTFDGPKFNWSAQLEASLGIMAHSRPAQVNLRKKLRKISVIVVVGIV